MPLVLNGTTGASMIQSNTVTSDKLSGIAGAVAWVNFNGTGTIAIRAAFNVSGITDNGVGRYIVNFSTAMPDTNYSVVASHHAVATLSNRNINIHSSSFQTTNTGEIGNVENNAVTDTDVMCVSIFR